MLFAGCTAFAGPMVEFGVFIEWINKRGDFAKMRTFSNFIPSIKRLF